MKLSTIMVITSVGLFLAVLTVYNFSLRAAYVRGTFRERFGEHAFQKLDGIKEIQLSNLMGISIEASDREGVWISDRVKNFVKVSRNEDVVNVRLIDQDSANYMIVYPSDVVFLVNKLEKIKAWNDQKQKSISNVGGEIMIKGLKLDLFQIEVAENCRVNIVGSRFNVFKSIVGRNQVGSSLALNSTNHIDTAYFDIRGSSSLQLHNTDILVPHYKFGDSSRVEFSGRAIKQFNK